MMPPVSTDALAAFPFLKELTAEFEKPNAPALVSIPAGSRVFEEGDDCAMIPLILTGVVRVYKMAENGREMTLYRVQRGESCILSISSLLGHDSLQALASVEEDCTALVLSPTVFMTWMRRYETVNRFVFDLLSKSLSSVLMIVEEVAFRRVDQRLVRFLLERKAEDNLVQGTHQSIATEIGTSREVVSRILKDFETQGLVQLQRGALVVLELGALQEKL